MLCSIDSISLVQSYERMPPSEYLNERNWSKKNGRIEGTVKWINNEKSDINQPRLTLYDTWKGIFRLRADLSIPEFLFGETIKLPSLAKIRESLPLISENVSSRSGLDFNAAMAQVCRADFAINHKINPNCVKFFINSFSNYNLPYLKKKIYTDETVYFGNKSRVVRIYDKFACVRKKEPKKNNLHEKAKGIIRAEYSFLSSVAVQRFAKRLGIKDTSGKTICSRKSLSLITKELSKLLVLDNIDFNTGNEINLIFEKTKDLGVSMRLLGFIKAYRFYGENFYFLKRLNYNKATYYRNLNDCKKIGISL